MTTWNSPKLVLLSGAQTSQGKKTVNSDIESRFHYGVGAMASATIQYANTTLS
jgi:hypothetical protein